jgi:hypothetical protein
MSELQKLCSCTLRSPPSVSSARNLSPGGWAMRDSRVRRKTAPWAKPESEGPAHPWEPDPSTRVLLLEQEGDLHVDLIALDVAVLDRDVLVLDPRALCAPERPGGAGPTASSTASSKPVSDVALNPVTQAMLMRTPSSPTFGLLPVLLMAQVSRYQTRGPRGPGRPLGCPDPLPPTGLLFDSPAGYALETLFACMPFWSWLVSQETLASSPRLLEPRLRYNAVVHEEVLTALIRGDEAVAPIVGKPLYRSLGHVWSPPFSLGWEAPPQQKKPLLASRAALYSP